MVAFATLITVPSLLSGLLPVFRLSFTNWLIQDILFLKRSVNSY